MVLVVRNDEMGDKYSILIRFDEQDSADSFYGYYNGRHFNSLEVCIATSVSVLWLISLHEFWMPIKSCPCLIILLLLRRQKFAKFFTQ